MDTPLSTNHSFTFDPEFGNVPHDLASPVIQDHLDTPNGASWWMADSLLDMQMPESMAGDMDALSNMLYRECADTGMTDMYQQEFGLMDVDGLEPLF